MKTAAAILTAEKKTYFIPGFLWIYAFFNIYGQTGGNGNLRILPNPPLKIDSRRRFDSVPFQGCF